MTLKFDTVSQISESLTMTFSDGRDVVLSGFHGPTEALYVLEHMRAAIMHRLSMTAGTPFATFSDAP